MRKWLIAIVLVAAAGVCLFVFMRPSRPASIEQASPSVTTARTNETALPLAAHSTSQTTVAAAATANADIAPASANSSSPDGSSKVSAQTSGILPEPEGELQQWPAPAVLENVRIAFRQYSSRFGGNPVGTNLEITRALNGGNPLQIRFLHMEDGMRVNARGELIDVWGTPYFFHQLSGFEMEIHSAGPDRKIWTRDDLVIK